MTHAHLALLPEAAVDTCDAGSPMTEMARWACAALSVGHAHEFTPARPRSWARQIATVTLFMEHRLGVPRNEALAVAVLEVARLGALTPGSIKKNRSEARAILQFGWDGGPPAAAPSARPVDLLHDLVAKVSVVRLADIRKLRSAALRGARGGRPAAGEMRILALVRRLRADALTDAISATEFEAIQRELARVD